jgi:hypothetical protein
MPEKTKSPAKHGYKSKALLNPRRMQSLLKRAHEALLNDAKDPQLTHEQKLDYLKTAAEYAKLLAAADTRRRSHDKAQQKADKNNVFSTGRLPWED